MFKTWDFVDPKLASKLKQVQEDLEELAHKRAAIQANSRISAQAKEKLLLFNDQCIKDLLQIRGRHKQSMIDYFDKQVSVLTKKEVSPVETQCKDRSSEKSNSLSKANQSQQLTKLTFDEDRSINCCNMDKTRHFNSFNSQRTKPFKLDNSNTTGRLTSKARSGNQTKSFELSTTERKYSPTGTTRKNANKGRATISRKYKMRMNRKIASKQFKFQMEKLFHLQTAEKLKRVEQERRQDRELIELLRKKITLLQLQQNGRIEEERQKLQTKYQSQVGALRHTFAELSKFQEHNRQLMVQRKEMLKLSK